MNNQATWQAINQLLNENVSLIPVRDKADGNRPPKTPFGSWKKYQTEIITREELFHQMEQYRTEAVAIVCGKVSGNLELIDVDVKQWLGIDARLFTDIRECYPDLWDIIRIHRTPSGGYHILYKVESGEVPGNKKLAYKSDCKESGIETRGEGGYALCPPSMGYAVHLNGDKPIPTITWEQRCSLINLCSTYNEKVQKAKSIYKEEYRDNYYSENPFEHYNGSIEAESVLLNNGWKLEGNNASFIHYCRPGKESGTSAAFCKNKRLYYFFTTSTEFEANKCYNPATVLAVLQFGNDKKRTNQWLVDNGYGKINPERELRIIEKAAINKKSLPANISEEAKQAYQVAIDEVNEKYPYGIFWRESEEGNITISRERILRISESLGFYLDGGIVKVEGYKVYHVGEREYFDAIKSYIKEDDLDEYDKIADAYEAFVQNSGRFTVGRLNLLDTDKILKSTRHKSFKFYQNCYLEIDKEGINRREYNSIHDMLIYDREILKRNFEFFEGGLYEDFLDKAIGITDHLKQTIGYLIHDYKDESMGYIIVLSEQCPDPKQGGGSGKNVFTSLLGRMSTWLNIPGSQVVFNENFLQSWNFERIVSISDVKKDFKFEFLKELSTGSGLINKKYVNQFTVTSDKMPKILVNTNFSFDITDGGLKRRIIPIEFTDFFTKAQGVNTYYGKMFPYDWTEEEFYSFDTFMVNCIHAYHKIDGKLFKIPLTATGRQKQFDMNYGELMRTFIEDNIESWIQRGNVPTKDIKAQYEAFYHEAGVKDNFRPTIIKRNQAIEEYCEWKGIEFKKNETFSMGGISQKCSCFIRKVS